MVSSNINPAILEHYGINSQNGTKSAESTEIGASVAEEVLEHYGIKGMKWGVRRKNPSGPPSKDAANAYSYRAQGKTQGVHTLTNKEIQAFLTRANLEQQFSRLTPSRPQQVQRFVTETLLGIGKDEVRNVMRTRIKGVGSKSASISPQQATMDQAVQNAQRVKKAMGG